MQILLKGGRVVYPGRFDDDLDILITHGKIETILPTDAGKGVEEKWHPDDPSKRIINLAGKIVTPGLIDMHVHFREPGQEHKETIETGSRSAVYGGFTAVCTMPNTMPANDSATTTSFIIKKAKKAGLAKVYPAAAISMGLEGKTLSDFRKLKQAGAVAFSDDGMPVVSSRLMRKALESAKKIGLPIISHCEDMDLSKGGVMNEGPVSDQLRLPGIPNASESAMVMRDIALSELTDAPVHIAHVSTREAVHAIRDAKKRGVPVTAETAPHYFTLTHDAVKDCFANAKMNPPLRSRQDREAILEGLSDGTIDVIATDHAPHHEREKSRSILDAPNGIIGLETAVALGIKLVRDKVLTWSELIDKMTAAPSKILNIPSGLEKGNPADITVIDPDKAYVVDALQFQSLSRNTPFDGWALRGKPVLTMVDGNVVYEDLD
jgi:dihydroorotase